MSASRMSAKYSPTAPNQASPVHFEHTIMTRTMAFRQSSPLGLIPWKQLEN
jgi:hypothetical protein